MSYLNITTYIYSIGFLLLVFSGILYIAMVGCRGMRDKGVYNHSELFAQQLRFTYIGNTPYRERGKVRYYSFVYPYLSQEKKVNQYTCKKKL